MFAVCSWACNAHAQMATTKNCVPLGEGPTLFRLAREEIGLEVLEMSVQEEYMYKKMSLFFLSVSTIMFRSKIIWCYNWCQKYPLLIVLQLSRTINLKYYLQLELIFRFKSAGDECQYKAQTFNWLVCICFSPLFPVTKITQCGHHEPKDEKWYQCTENYD